MKNQMFQNVRITVNGEQFTFYGPAIPWGEGTIIEEIKFSEPRKLPKGYKFTKVKLIK